MSLVAVPRGIRCVCACHRESPLVPFTGVDVTDAIEAVTACDACRRYHCAALLERTIWDDTVPRERVPWVDPSYPPETPDRGEGAES